MPQPGFSTRQFSRKEKKARKNFEIFKSHILKTNRKPSTTPCRKRNATQRNATQQGFLLILILAAFSSRSSEHAAIVVEDQP
jgi:hypothetical protein